MESGIVGRISVTATDGTELTGPASPSQFARQSSRLRRGLVFLMKIASVAGILAVLGARFSALDSAGFWTLLRSAGWWTAVVLLPPLLALLADSAGLAFCLRAPLSWPVVRRVLPARLGCDTLSNAIPGGVALAETFRPIVLSRSLGADIKECVAASLMGKANMAGAQALVLLGTALVVLTHSSPAGSPLSGVSAVVAAVLVAGLCALLALFYSGPRLTQLQQFLVKFPRARWQAFLSKHLPAIAEVDDRVRSFSRGEIRRLVGSLGSFVAGWVLAGGESYAILTLLGNDVSILQGLMLEGTASLMRIVFFFLPSAIGAAEVGYATLIASFGVADPVTVSAAFIALKRTREVLWMAGGFAMLIRNGWKAGESSLQPALARSHGRA